MVEIPTVLYDWSSSVQYVGQPATELEAIMGSAPLTDLESLDRKMALREAVVSCFDQLSPEDQFVLEAICFERITVRELASRLGLQKSRTHRIAQRAVKRLATIVQEHPVVQEALATRG